MKKFLVLFVVLTLVLATTVPAMAWDRHHRGYGSYRGYRSSYHSGYYGPLMAAGAMTGAVIIGTVIGTVLSPPSTYYYAPLSPQPTCVGQGWGYDQWGNRVQVPITIPCR